MNKSLYILLFTLFLVPTFQSHGAENNQSLPLSGGDAAPARFYQASSGQLIIWLPSEFGMKFSRIENIAKSIRKQNISVWLVDLHAGYFVQRGRNSLQQFKAHDLANLVRIAGKKGYRKVYFMTSSGGARPAVKAAWHWQKQNPGQTLLRGLIFLHPTLYRNRPAAGQDAQYMREAWSMNLPIYVFQPEQSSLALRLQQAQKTLLTGGSPVYIHYLPGVKDGFTGRPIEHLNKEDRTARKEFPVWLKHALRLLQTHKLPSHAASLKTATVTAVDTAPGLKAVLPPYPAPELELRQLDDQVYKPGKAVRLVSFWASWCPPCVREIPSMNRLQAQYDRKRFQVVAINLGEDKKTIRRFLKKHKINATVLLDISRLVSKLWKVYVVPTNYLVDKQGRVRYASVGAVDWNTGEIKRLINRLIHE